ncbi:MAG: hypothetical protein H7A09_02615 [Oceanospirillaceae bacterium]|nr:hypothetical protein [Oceanospirillaceae bacterium]MCP5351182.1 hypothetical protein [Oceanospirillaceae bacterium]
MRWIVLLALVIGSSGCARLDRVQIGDIDQSRGELVEVEVQLSELGLNMAGIAETGRIATRGKASQDFKELRDILALINMGPKTGNPVFDDTYAQRLQEYLLVKCPSGRLTSIRSVREAKGFGPVTGEIVGVKADCIR